MGQEEVERGGGVRRRMDREEEEGRDRWRRERVG